MRNGYNRYEEPTDKPRSYLRRPARDAYAPHKDPYIGLMDHYLTVVETKGEKTFELPTHKGALRFDSLKAYEIFLNGRIRLHNADGHAIDIRMTQSVDRNVTILSDHLAFSPKTARFQEGAKEASFLRARDLNVGDYLLVSLPKGDNPHFSFESFLKHSYLRATAPKAGPRAWVKDLTLADKGAKPLPEILRFPANTI